MISEFIHETQISKAKRLEICKSNNPDIVGRYKPGLALSFIPVIQYNKFGGILFYLHHKELYHNTIIIYNC